MVISLNKVNVQHQLTDFEAESRNRDPGAINTNVKLLWSSVIGEPETLRSPDWVWKLSSVSFTFVHLWTYKILTVIFGPLLAFIIAVLFAILGFLQVWCFHPVNKFVHVIFCSVRTMIQILSHSVLGPCLETLGLCLSNLRIRHQRIYDAKEEPTYPFII